MIQMIDIGRILFLDIEAVPGYPDWEQMDPTGQMLWDKKTKNQRGEDIPASEWYEERGGFLAEFGKIICISVGMVLRNTNKLKIQSFAGDDEEKLLKNFGEIFNNKRMHDVILCAHNGKEFDFPYISRRMMINGIMPPTPLQTFGKKPWEIPHLDTLELWKLGEWKNHTSLDLLAWLLNIPSPKTDMDGSQVAEVYYKQKDLERIIRYCEQDVLCLANVFQRMRQQDLLKPYTPPEE